MSVGIFYRYHIVLRRLKCVRTLKMKSPSRLGPVEIVLVPLKVWAFLETEVGAHSVLYGHGGLLLQCTDESGAGALSPLAGASSQRCCSGHWNPVVILWAVPSVKLWWTLCKVPMAVGWPVWGTECLGAGQSLRRSTGPLPLDPCLQLPQSNCIAEIPFQGHFSALGILWLSLRCFAL